MEWAKTVIKDVEPPKTKPSVLSDWKSYQDGTKDVEKGGNDGKEQGVGGSLLTGLSELVKKVNGGGEQSNGSNESSVTQMISISYQSWVYFGCFAGAGVLLLLLSFFVFLPMIILAPSKFAITFSVGSGCLVTSIGFLKGWKDVAASLVTKERLPFTGAYFGSLLGTLYAAMIMHSYVITMCMCGVQILTLVYYIASFIPGGASGAHFIFGSMLRGGLGVFRAIFSSK